MDGSMYLPASILLSVIILSGTLFMVGAQISDSLTDVSVAVEGVEFVAPTGSIGGNGDLVPSTPPDTAPPAPTVDVEALPDDDPFEGNEDATVTIVEFSDFQCPFCSRFYTQTLPQLREEYIDTGKVKLVYRDFPLNSLHPQAQPASEASECADDQGKFWEFHDKIFENQSSLSDAAYKQWAEELGLDTEEFNECVDSEKYRGEVLADLAAGQAAGVSGTPTFFINGQKIVGAQPFSVFKQIIDAELA